MIRNYHQEGLWDKQEPLIFRFFENNDDFYSVKVNPLNIKEVIDFVEYIWYEFYPQNPFDYFFLEDYYNEQYRNEMRFGRIFGLFTFLAIFIACLGLFGLSSFTTLQRKREIGIRKVLGSSSANAVLQLIRFFVIQVMIAVPFGLGCAYFAMSGWLRDFAYRTGIGWWFFMIPVLMVLIIAILTVAVQVLRTAGINPAVSLRHE